jgi:acetyl esterase/lipase
VQGTADRVIDPSQSTNFAKALTHAGVPATVTLLPGVPHGFRFGIKSENMKKVLQFLSRALGS